MRTSPLVLVALLSVGCHLEQQSSGISSTRGGGGASSSLDGGGAPPCAGGQCRDYVLVPGGTFPMGRSDSGADAFAVSAPDEQPEHDASVPPFYLDRYEVTVGRFRAFLAAYDAFVAALAVGAGAHPGMPESGWEQVASSDWDLLPDAATLDAHLACDGLAGTDECSACVHPTWTHAPGDGEARPINCVTWAEAFAFCVWDGGHLPTEAEWEYAAAGGDENRLYPWGTDGDPTALAIAGCAFGGAPSLCDVGDIAPVGSRPAGAGRWGHLDLAGNVDEWVLDEFGADFYGTPHANPCVNCADLKPGAERALRGGSWATPSGGALRSAHRDHAVPGRRNEVIGLRCARTGA